MCAFFLETSPSFPPFHQAVFLVREVKGEGSCHPAYFYSRFQGQSVTRIPTDVIFSESS